MRRVGRAALAIVGGLLIGGQVLPMSRAAAEDVSTVDSWIELSATSPAADCPISASVELRRDGFAVAGTEVLMALYVDSELVSADRIATDDDGIAFLEIDGSAADGQDAWVDITLNDQYWWGHPVAPGAGSGCSDGYLLDEKSGWAPGNAVSTGDTAEDAFLDDQSGSDAVESGSGSFIPEVGFYVQQRNLSCEYASLYIATAAWNDPISEYAFDETVGWSANPHWGFRGDINGWWGNTDDYGVYPEVLSGALAQFGFSGDVFYGGADRLTAKIDAGVPTLVWLGLWGDQSFYEYAEDGTAYKLTPGYHVGVVYGYDDGGVYLSDPALGGSRYYDWGTFMYYWNVLDGMALGVSPA